MGDLAPVLVLTSFMAGLVWIVWIVFNNRRRIRIAEVQRELQVKLFEKFGTSQELLEYLKTDAGNKFLNAATIEQTKPFGRVLGSMQAGLIFFLLGVALFIVRGTLPTGAFYNATDQLQTGESFLVISLLLLALGIGFVASAGISYWMSKKWGILDSEPTRQR
jgi:hypothetical protein